MEEKDTSREYSDSRPEEEEIVEEEDEEKQKALANMLITSGFSFDGYTIVKYSGYISGDDAVEISRDSLSSLFNFKGKNKNKRKTSDLLLTDALVKIRRQAIAELKEAAYALGCNAVIGVDFDYITMESQTHTYNVPGAFSYTDPYVICVTANGNAVIIEKNK